MTVSRFPGVLCFGIRMAIGCCSRLVRPFVVKVSSNGRLSVVNHSRRTGQDDRKGGNYHNIAGMMMQAEHGNEKISLGASWANVCSGKFANVWVESGI